jgi:hypothetical protein
VLSEQIIKWVEDLLRDRSQKVSNLRTSFSSIRCSAHLNFVSLGKRLGISPSGSLVKTLLKNPANTSALSLSFSVMFTPFSVFVFNSDISDFVFLFEFAYF